MAALKTPISCPDRSKGISKIDARKMGELHYNQMRKLRLKEKNKRKEEEEDEKNSFEA